MFNFFIEPAIAELPFIVLENIFLVQCIFEWHICGAWIPQQANKCGFRYTLFISFGDFGRQNALGVNKGTLFEFICKTFFPCLIRRISKCQISSDGRVVNEMTQNVRWFEQLFLCPLKAFWFRWSNVVAIVELKKGVFRITREAIHRLVRTLGIVFVHVWT